MISRFCYIIGIAFITSITSVLHGIRITNAYAETVHITIEIPQTAILFNETLTKSTFTIFDLEKQSLSSETMLYITIIPESTGKILYGKLTKLGNLHNDDELVIARETKGKPRVYLIAAIKRAPTTQEEPDSVIKQPSYTMNILRTFNNILNRLLSSK